MVRIERCHPFQGMLLRKNVMRLFHQEPSRFVDRGRRFLNKGVAGDSGYYYSLRYDACPKAIVDELVSLAPQLPELELDQAYINVYPPGSFLPPHRDSTGQGHLAMAVAPLQSDPEQGLTWYAGPGVTEPRHIADVLGQVLVFKSLSVVHEVPLVSRLRLSAVFLYR